MYKGKGWDDEVDGGSDEEGGEGCSDGESGDLTARSISESTSPSQVSSASTLTPMFSTILDRIIFLISV